MTVGTTNLTNTFTGDGASFGPFAFTFAAQATKDVYVSLGGIVQSSGYVVTLNLNADGTTGVGGSVMFTTTPPALSAAGVIGRSCDLLQAMTLPVEGNLSESKLINAFDRLTMIAQQITASVIACVQLPTQFQGIISGILTPPFPALYVARMNAAGNAIEFVSPAAALAQAAPIPGGGTVVGPANGTTTNWGLAFFADSTGQLIKGTVPTGAAGTVPISTGPTTAPIWGTGLPANLRSLSIVGAGRQFPTSGAVSGTYWHSGNWTSTGAITAAPGTRVYVSGLVTLAHALTVSTDSAGGQSMVTNATPAQLTPPSQGQGAGGGGTALPGTASVVVGGGGGGNGGAGGNGGSLTASTIALGGYASPYQDSFSGSGGGSSYTSVASSTGSAGGAGGGGFYIECLLAFTITTGSITANGAVGGTPVTANQGGGGGGSGGTVGIRCNNVLTLPINSITCNGGAGGPGGAGGGGGGGGGGGIIDLAAATLAVNGSALSVAGGAAGTGAAAQPASAGSAGTTNQVTTNYPVSIF